jgi:hypothetical protein
MKKMVLVFLSLAGLIILGLAFRKSQTGSVPIATVPASMSHDAPEKQNVTIAAPASIADEASHPVAANLTTFNSATSRPVAAIIGREAEIASPPARINETNVIFFRSNIEKTNREIDTRQATVIVGG